MLKVYVLVCNYLNVDSGDCNTEILGVYEDFGLAQYQMERHMVDIRNEFGYCDVEESDYVDGDMSWSIWEKGEYMSHHCDLIIEEKDFN